MAKSIVVSDEEALRAIETARGAWASEAQNMIVRSVQMADALATLRQWVTPEMLAKFRSLSGSTLGFRTDRDPGTKAYTEKGEYNDAVMKDCIIEAAILGLEWVGNQFNIIAGRTYTTQNGMWWLVGRKSPGVTNVRVNCAVPRIATGGAVVKARCDWKKDGVADFIEEEIPVKVNDGMGTDAIIGKATRKILARAHRQIHGSVFVPEGDVDDTKPSEASRAAEVGTRIAADAIKTAEGVPPQGEGDGALFVNEVDAIIDATAKADAERARQQQNGGK
jgi:hypothetical protein